MTHSTKSKEEIDKIIEDAMQFAENSEKGLAELKAMGEHKQFLLEEYHKNPGWFGEDGSIEDIIKTCFDYGWACRGDYEYKESASPIKNAKKMVMTPEQEKAFEESQYKNGWKDIGWGLKRDRNGNIAGGLKRK